MAWLAGLFGGGTAAATGATAAEAATAATAAETAGGALASQALPAAAEGAGGVGVNAASSILGPGAGKLAAAPNVAPAAAATAPDWLTKAVGMTEGGGYGDVAKNVVGNLAQKKFGTNPFSATQSMQPIDVMARLVGTRIANKGGPFAQAAGGAVYNAPETYRASRPQSVMQPRMGGPSYSPFTLA